jgi:hypothetical protein
MMGLIYSRTTGVIAYLAPFIDTLRETKAFDQSKTLYGNQYAAIQAEDDDAHRFLAMPFIDPYWTRIWIVQEVYLAPRIIWLYEDLWLTAEGLQDIAKKPSCV